MRLLDKKVRKVMGMRTDTPDMVEALDALAGFYGKRAGGNTLEARRALRSDLEWQALSVSHRFLEKFEEIETRFETASDIVEEVQQACGTMRDRLRRTEEDTATFVARVQALQKEQARLSAREEAVRSFLDAFELTEAEVRALRDAPLEADGGRAFFAALDRLDAVRARCDELLSGAAQSAAVDVVERVSAQQEGALERLFHWVQDRAGEVGGADDSGAAGDTTALMAEAVRRLRARPAFFAHARESVVSVRRSALAHRFVLALTRGGPGGTPRPIELGAHDPLRYAGDLLAWLHQAAASERDLLEAVFGPDAAAPAPPASGGEGAGEAAGEGAGQADGEAAGAVGPSLLARALEGVARPARVRLAQALGGDLTPAVLFRLRGLLSFYAETLAAAVPGPSATAEAAAALARDADAKFWAALRARADALVASPPAPPHDLSPPRAVTDTAARLCDVLVAHRDAMAPAQRDAAPTERAVDALVRPLMHTVAAAGAAQLPRADAAVFAINCANAMRAALAPHAAAAAWVQRLAAECDEQVDALVAATAAEVVAEGGAGRALAAARAAAEELRAAEAEAEAEARERGGQGQGEREQERERGATAAPPGYRPLARREGSGAEQAAMAAALRSFGAALFSARMPTFDRVLAPRQRVQARTRVAHAVADAYAELHAAVVDPRNGYVDAAALAPHSPAEVRVLLDAE